MTAKEQFEKDVEKLSGMKERLPLEVRIKQVEDLTEWFYRQTGKHYKGSFHLDLLGSYILADDLKNKETHKVKQTEYPILSHTQQRLRKRRENLVGDDNIDFLKLKKVDNHANAFKKTTKNKDE